MELIYYLLYFVASWYSLMFVYRFSTYHTYFAFMSIILIIFSILSAYLLYLFELHEFFLWHIVIMLFLLFKNYTKQKKSMNTYEESESKSLDSETELSFEKTFKYHILSSVIYLTIFSLSYLYLYNS